LRCVLPGRFIFLHIHDGIQVAPCGKYERSNLVTIKRFLSVVVLGFVFSHGSSDTQAQTTRERKLEVSGLYTTINLEAFDSRESGVGVRLSYNVNKYLAIEAEGNAFEVSLGDYPTDEWLAAQGLLGIRTGFRNRRFGLFAKVRPGVVNFPKLRVHQRFCIPLQHCEDAGKGGNRLAVDAGAVIEVYPTKNIIVRLDIGDTMIRFKDDQFFRASSFVKINDGFSHNIQLAGSVGFRF
jgi:hypothetical protein